MPLRISTLLAFSALGVFAATCSKAPAQLLAYEGFEYDDGATIIGEDGGLGFNIGWTNDITSEPTNVAAVASSLVDTNGVMPNRGGAVELTGIGGNVRIFRTLDTTLPAFAPFLQGGELGADGTTLYMSLLVQHGDLENFEDPDLARTNILELGTGSLGSTANGAFVVGIDGAGGSPQTRAVTEKQDQNDFVSIGDFSLTPDLVVMKIDFADGDDTLSLFLNPSSDATEPASPTGTITGDFGFNRIGLAAFQQSPIGVYDEIKLAGSYADLFTLPPDETVPGDADNDGDVDLNDFFAIRDNFFSQVAIGGLGDVSGGGFDGAVNLNDYVIWKREFEALPANAGVTAPALFTTVPEPASIGVVLLACVGGGVAGRRR